MKILALPGREPGHACTDYRMSYPYRILMERGLIQSTITVTTDLATISKYNLVVFQRQEMPLVEEVTRATQQASDITIQSSWVAEGLAWNDATRIEGAHRAGKPVIFDIDDDALHVPVTNPNYLQWGRDARKIANALAQWKGPKPLALSKPAAVIAAQAKANFKQLLKNIAAADAVTVTTPALKRVYGKYNKRVYVLPNWAEPREWQNVHPQEHEGIHIGWAGGPTHFGDLAVVAAPVGQILKEYPETHLVLAGFPIARELLFADVPDEQITVYPFMDKWKKNLTTFDIILAPSEANQFNEAKSAIRIYEGLLATKGHAAVVGSETTYGDAIRALRCGYVCKNRADWLKSLRTLVENASKRAQMGREGYERVMAGCTYGHHAGEWLKVYREVLNG